MRIILGLDPGSRVAGYGIVRVDDGDPVHVVHGVFRLPENVTFDQRLFHLGKGLRDILQNFQPTEVVVERIFLGRNPDSAFKLGHARGVFLYESAQTVASIHEYGAREVKKGITGNGAASKEQVRAVVLAMLKITSDLPEDATDALAMAIHHGNMVQVKERMKLRLREGIL